MFKSLKERVKEKEKDSGVFEQIEAGNQIITNTDSNAIDLAKVKQELHLVIEEKEIELDAAKKKCTDLLLENNKLTAKYERLKKSIVEEKKRYENFISEVHSGKIDNLKVSLEGEKDEEFKELRRGKLEALQVLQTQHQERILILEKEKLKEIKKVESFWKDKYDKQEKIVEQKYMVKLISEQEEMALAVEVQDLQKRAAVSTLDNRIQLLETENNNLTMERDRMSININELNETICNLTSTADTIKMENSIKIEMLEGAIKELLDTLEMNKREYERTIEEAKVAHAEVKRDLTNILDVERAKNCQLLVAIEALTLSNEELKRSCEKSNIDLLSEIENSKKKKVPTATLR